MALREVLTDDAADLEVLSKANERGRFAVPLVAELPVEVQFAFERGMDREWYRFVDLSPIAHVSGLMRVYALTDAGRARLAELKRSAA